MTNQCPPLFYYPTLKLALKSVTASIVMVYLETHLPAPQDPPGARPAIATQPVTLDLDAVAQDIGINRRTLYVCLCILAARHPTEEARASAARAGREFLEPRHHRYGSIKYYSAAGPSTYTPGTVIQLRRNRLLLDRLLQQAGFSRDPQRLAIPNTDIGCPHVSALSAHSERGNEAISHEIETLGDILMRASTLNGDRRTVRYDRLRAAEKRGLVPDVILGKLKSGY